MKKHNLPHKVKPCGNCPFTKNCMKGWLGEKRMTEIIKSDSFVCHKNTKLQCAGHMLLLGNDNVFVRTANNLAIELNLQGRELVFDDAHECITHHKNR